MKPSGGNARFSRCPPGACKRHSCPCRCLPRRLSDYHMCRRLTLFFGVCCAAVLGFLFFFSLLKRKKEAKKEKISPTLVCAAMYYTKDSVLHNWQCENLLNIISSYRANHVRPYKTSFQTKIPRRGGTGGCCRRNAALFSPLYWGVRLSSGSPSLGESAVAISAGRRAEHAARLPLF